MDFEHWHSVRVEMLVESVFWGICKGAYPPWPPIEVTCRIHPPIGLVPYGLYSHPRGIDEAEEIDFHLCPDLAI